jgi:hypothetical protein
VGGVAIEHHAKHYSDWIVYGLLIAICYVAISEGQITATYKLPLFVIALGCGGVAYVYYLLHKDVEILQIENEQLKKSAQDVPEFNDEQSGYQFDDKLMPRK